MTKFETLTDLADERERVFQGALENVESEVGSDEVFVMVVLRMGQRGRGRK